MAANSCRLAPWGEVVVRATRWTMLAAMFFAFLSTTVAARAQPCGPQWLPGEGVPGVLGRVAALAVLPSGEILAGGTITVAGTTFVNRITRYDPATATWSDLGSGVAGPNASVNAITVLPGGDIVVAGLFTSAGGAIENGGVLASNIARYSPATSTWTAMGAGTDTAILSMAVLPGGDLVVGGSFTTAGGVPVNRIARCNPTTNAWSALGAGVIHPTATATVSAVTVLPGGDIVAAGTFARAGSATANNIARCNPATNTWSAMGTIPGATAQSVAAMTLLPTGELAVGGRFTLTGGNTRAGIARINTSTNVWSAVAVTGQSLVTIVALPEGDMVFAGDGPMGRYNPESESVTYVNPIIDPYVYALVLLPNGNVLVGGSFQVAGGVAASGIARYDPGANSWSALSSGTAGLARALAIVPGGDVIVGGELLTAGGAFANGIARHSPATDAWTPLGTGVLGDVKALAILPNGDLVVGGNFPAAGNWPARGIARYRPSTGTWSAIGPGLSFPPARNGVAVALAPLPDGRVVVGGSFLTAGAVVANNIAICNPADESWIALGSGLSSSAASIAPLPNGDIVVGGSFTTAGGVEARRIARYTPATNAWLPLGAGVEGGSTVIVRALTVLPGGDIIAGGAFTTAGGVPARNIARYHAATNEWSAMGAGVSGVVYALVELPDGDIVAGGNFSSAGGVPARNVARYNLESGTWTALGPGTDASVLAIEVRADGDLLVGGNFISAAGNTSVSFARYRFGSPCPIDMNCDNAVDVNDLLAFLTGFEAGSVLVDLDNDGEPTTGTPDGAVTIDDLLYFLVHFEAGC